MVVGFEYLFYSIYFWVIPCFTVLFFGWFLVNLWFIFWVWHSKDKAPRRCLVCFQARAAAWNENILKNYVSSCLFEVWWCISTEKHQMRPVASWPGVTGLCYLHNDSRCDVLWERLNLENGCGSWCTS